MIFLRQSNAIVATLFVNPLQWCIFLCMPSYSFHRWNACADCPLRPLVAKMISHHQPLGSIPDASKDFLGSTETVGYNKLYPPTNKIPSTCKPYYDSAVRETWKTYRTVRSQQLRMMLGDVMSTSESTCDSGVHLTQTCGFHLAEHAIREGRESLGYCSLGYFDRR